MSKPTARELAERILAMYTAGLPEKTLAARVEKAVIYCEANLSSRQSVETPPAVFLRAVLHLLNGENV